MIDAVRCNLKILQGSLREFEMNTTNYMVETSKIVQASSDLSKFFAGKIDVMPVVRQIVIVGSAYKGEL